MGIEDFTATYAMKSFWAIVYAKTKLVLNVSPAVSASIDSMILIPFSHGWSPEKTSWHEFLFSPSTIWVFDVIYCSNSFQPRWNSIPCRVCLAPLTIRAPVTPADMNVTLDCLWQAMGWLSPRGNYRQEDIHLCLQDVDIVWRTYSLTWNCSHVCVLCVLWPFH